MGRSKFLAPVRTGTSRRTFLSRSGSAAAALASAVALPLAPGVTQAAGPLFQHGVASGDPLADRVILWTRITPQSPRRTAGFRWLVARDPGLRDVVQRGDGETSVERDFTVKVDAVGLSPGSTYYYRFFAENEASPIGRTRTLPVGATSRLRIAVASCSNYVAGLFNAYRRIAERADLDFVLHLGDYTYDHGAVDGGRVPEPSGETITLSDYRTRHAQYKRDADLQEMHRQHPMICIWDDGEIANDAWRDGALNHTEGAEGTWPERVAMALKAYYEWMPVRMVDPTQPRRNERAFHIGDLVDLLMLEERLSARSRQLPATIPIPGFIVPGFVQAGPFADPSRTMLGAEQEAWLAAQLRDSAARWKVIGQQVMFAQLKALGAPLALGGGVFINPDQWDGYQPARDRVYAVLKGDATHAPVGDVVILTGDLHSSFAADLTQDPDNPVVAAGGYDPATGNGSRAVEFVATSITSPFLVPDPTGAIAALLRSRNPHIKFIDLNQHGYMLLDLTRERAVCEWWFVDTVVAPSSVQTLGAAFEVQHGSNRLAPSAMTAARMNPPPPAP